MKTKNGRIALTTSAAAIALVAAAPAFAQDDAAGAAKVATSESVTNNEIVVTAQKRPENLKDVPISISVLAGKDLVESGATQLTDYAAYVPGLQVDSFGTPGQARIAVRGISPLGANASVGIYIDEAPIGSSSVYTNGAGHGLDLLPYDIARIEVLRGPQGTLYGASSIGGLLKYVTVSPTLDKLSGRVGVEGFDIAHGGGVGLGAQGIVNAPLVAGKLGITASLSHRHTPGWIDNAQTGETDQNDLDQTSGRVALLWQAAPNFSARLSGLWQKTKADNQSNIVASPVGVRVGDGLSNFNYVPEPFRETFQYYAGTLDWDLGAASLSSTTTFSRSKTMVVTDASRIFGTLFPLLTGGAVPAGVTPLRVDIDLKKFTEEVRLTSASGRRFEWLIGAFYTHEKASHEQLVNSYSLSGQPVAGLDPLATVSLPSTYEEYALFGNATFRVTDAFHITGGLRWAHNNQDFRQISAGAIVPAANDPGSSSESIVTYSVSPQLHLGANTMVYFRVASGYRPGGPNVVLPGVPPTFDADTLTNYELGLKTQSANGIFSFDGALFRMDWNDIQVSKAFGGTSGLDNGGTARSQGVEAAFIVEPTAGLTLGLNGAYTDSELTEDAPSVNGLKGDQLPRIPRWSGSLTANYDFDLGADARAQVGGGLRYTGKRFSDVESDPNALVIAATTALDLNASVTFARRWTVRAYVRNLFDSASYMSRAVINDGLNQPAYINGFTLQPRTIGLALELGF